MDNWSFTYCNVDDRSVSGDINALFPGFGGDEVLLVMSPHDDDAVIGAGYAMLAARQAGAEVYVMISCRGDAGYSTVEEKDTIEEVRVQETCECYARLGLDRDHIVRLNFPDFSAISRWGWEKADGAPGEMPTVLQFLRDRKVTRVMVPNHYHEHIDHLATYMMGSYNAPQAGDAMLVDHGTPHAVRSTLEYSVWADLDPENALVSGRDVNLRANRVLVAGGEVEAAIDRAIEAYVSQGQIIENLVASRKARRTAKGGFVEVYIAFDPRPKISFQPYVSLIDSLL